MQNDDFNFNFDDDFESLLNSTGEKPAETQPAAAQTSRSAIDDYEPYTQEEEPARSGSGALKYILLAVAAVLIVAVLVILCVRIGRSAKSSVTNAAADANLSSSITIRDSYGQDVGDNITITAGVTAPDNISISDAVLADINWTGSDPAEYPLIITISDPTFEDDDGLVIFEYIGGQWTQLETYLISEHSVTFMTDSLGSFAFVPYSKLVTPTASPSPTPTATPKASETPKPSASPSATPSDNDTGNSGTNYSSAVTPSAVVSGTITDPDSNNGGNGNNGESTVIHTEAPVQEEDDNTGGGDTGGGDSGGGTGGGTSDATSSNIPEESYSDDTE